MLAEWKHAVGDLDSAMHLCSSFLNAGTAPENSRKTHRNQQNRGPAVIVADIILCCDRHAGKREVTTAVQQTARLQYSERGAQQSLLTGPDLSQPPGTMYSCVMHGPRHYHAILQSSDFYHMC